VFFDNGFICSPVRQNGFHGVLIIYLSVNDGILHNHVDYGEVPNATVVWQHGHGMPPGDSYHYTSGVCEGFFGSKLSVSTPKATIHVGNVALLGASLRLPSPC
jgi:hypothetical protein